MINARKESYRNNKAVRAAVEWLAAFLIAFLLCWLLGAFAFRFAGVSGLSMMPTLDSGDTLIMEKLSYRFTEPKAGDIIAFPYKEDETKLYVKRIIGVPGQTVGLEAGYLTLDGQRLSDGFSDMPLVSYGNIDYPYTVPEGCYFVLGDNRSVSEDSRYKEVGAIKRESIIGKAWLRLLPLQSIRFFN